MFLEIFHFFVNKFGGTKNSFYLCRVKYQKLKNKTSNHKNKIGRLRDNFVLLTFCIVRSVSELIA